MTMKKRQDDKHLLQNIFVQFLETMFNLLTTGDINYFVFSKDRNRKSSKQDFEF